MSELTLNSLLPVATLVITDMNYEVISQSCLPGHVFVSACSAPSVLRVSQWRREPQPYSIISAILAEIFVYIV